MVKNINWNEFFWQTLASFIGSMICLLWLPFIQAISIFVGITISKIIMEGIFYNLIIKKKYEK